MKKIQSGIVIPECKKNCGDIIARIDFMMNRRSSEKTPDLLTGLESSAWARKSHLTDAYKIAISNLIFGESVRVCMYRDAIHNAIQGLQSGKSSESFSNSIFQIS